MLFSPLPNSSTRLICQATLLAALCLGVVAVGASAAEPDSPTMRLRVAWGGGAPAQWTGRVSVTGGELRDLSLLGREADTPGSIWIDNTSVLIAQPRPRTIDGFDITVHSPTSKTLRLEMRAAQGEQPTVVEIPLANLMSGQHRSTLPTPTDAAGTTLQVHRVADDALRIEIDRDHLIFVPGETFRCQVQPVIDGLTPGGAIDLALDLRRGRRSTQEWSHSYRVSIPPRGSATVPVEIPLPMREGVYTVHMVARTPPGNRVKFWEAAASQQLAERSFQVVVLDGNAASHYVNAEWQTLLEIDPANPKWWNRMPEWTRIDRWAGPAAGPLGSEPFRTTVHRGATLAELTASVPGRPSWQAYPLPAARPGKPHVIEVDLPSDIAQRLVVRVYEPDASGKLVPNGPGGGVAAEVSLGDDDRPLTTYRYLFWPRTKSPFAVIENGDQQQVAKYGKIRLRSAIESTTPVAEIDTSRRLVAAYFDWNALLARTDARALTADGRHAIDDWLTFYQAADRLVELLELSGFNAAVVNVLDDGSAVYATDAATIAPTLNNSRLASGASDLPAIDPLELALRMFSRRGLRLVPSLRFSGTLPGVEKKLMQKRYRTLEEFPLWTNLQGQPRHTVRPGTRTAAPPHYRVAHEDVASELLAMVEQVAHRTAPHPAYAGLAIEIPEDSYLASPPADYGITGPRLARFAEDIETDRATLDSWIKQPSKMLGDATLRRQWMLHRTAPVTNFLTQAADRVRAENESASLLVLPPELLDSAEFDLRPRLVGSKRLDEMYLERGLHVEVLAQQPGVELAGVRHAVPGVPLADAARPLEWNRQARSAFATTNHAALTWQHPAEFESPQSSDFAPPTAGDRLLYEQPQAARLSIGQLYDDDGGALVVGGPLGPAGLANSEQQQLRRLLTSMSLNESIHSTRREEQPVSVRVYDDQNTALVVVTNDSPWHTSATVTIEVEQRTTAQPVDPANSAIDTVTSYTPGRHIWQVKLAAFEFQAIRFNTSQVSVSGLRVEVAADVEAQLVEQCRRLERRDLKPDNLAPYALAPNPSFDATDATGMALDWLPEAAVPTVTPGVDDGRAARLSSTGDGMQLATHPFPAPSTGQTALTAYVKVIEVADDALLRLIIEPVGGVGAPQHRVELDAERLRHDSDAKEWNAYQFGVDDMPLASDAEMRIRVELLGAGEVLVDNLQVHDLVYPLEIYPEESDESVLALVQHVKAPRRAVEARKYRDCAQMLEGYWPQFVLAYLPEIKTPPTDANSPDAAGDLNTAEKPAARLSDRLRGWFRFD